MCAQQIAETYVSVKVDTSELNAGMAKVQQQVNKQISDANSKYNKQIGEVSGRISQAAGQVANNIRNILTGALAYVAIAGKAFSKDTSNAAKQVQAEWKTATQILNTRLSSVFQKILNAPLWGNNRAIDFIYKLSASINRISQQQINAFVKAVEGLAVLFLATKAIEAFTKSIETMIKLSEGLKTLSVTSGLASGVGAAGGAGFAGIISKLFGSKQTFTPTAPTPIGQVKEAVSKSTSAFPTLIINRGVENTVKSITIISKGLFTLSNVLKGLGIGLVISALIRVISYTGGFKSALELLGSIMEKVGSAFEIIGGVINELIDAIAGRFIWLFSIVKRFFSELSKIPILGSGEKIDMSFKGIFDNAQKEYNKFMDRNKTQQSPMKSVFNIEGYKEFNKRMDEINKDYMKAINERADLLNSKLGFSGERTSFTEAINYAQDIQMKWADKMLDDSKKLIELNKTIADEAKKGNDLQKEFLRMVSAPAGTEV